LDSGWLELLAQEGKAHKIVTAGMMGGNPAYSCQPFPWPPVGTNNQISQG